MYFVCIYLLLELIQEPHIETNLRSSSFEYIHEHGVSVLIPLFIELVEFSGAESTKLAGKTQNFRNCKLTTEYLTAHLPLQLDS